MEKVIVTKTVKLTIKRLGKATAGIATAAAAITALATPVQAATITTTYHHPFYDITQSAFVDANHLQPGDLLQSTNATTAQITSTRRFHNTTTTYDLTINGLHTYYVEAGPTPILVHNCPMFRKGTKSSGRPDPNATVGDLRDINTPNVDGSPVSNMKTAKLRSLSDKDLLDSVFSPADHPNDFMGVTRDGSSMLNGNHRATELMRRAGLGAGSITWDTPIYIRGFGG